MNEKQVLAEDELPENLKHTLLKMRHLWAVLAAFSNIVRLGVKKKARPR